MLPPSPDEGERRANRFRATADAVSIGSPHPIARGPAEYQQAGLTAGISLAWATAQIRQPPTPAAAAKPRSWFEPPASPADWGADSALARPGPAIAPPAQVIDPPAPVIDRPSVTANNRGLAYVRPLLLIAILTVQALLSLRLVWSNSAYVDEATYLWAGHLEIAHWLHGG